MVTFYRYLGIYYGCFKWNHAITCEKYKDICVLIHKLLKKRRVKLNKFQKLVGKLQHSYMGIP